MLVSSDVPLHIPAHKAAHATISTGIVPQLSWSGYQIDGGTRGRLASLSADGNCMVFSDGIALEFVSRDPTRLRRDKMAVDRVIAGSDYTGLVFSSRDLCPWMLSATGVTYGVTEQARYGSWGRGVAAADGTYVVEDGTRLVRIFALPDGSRVIRGPEIALPRHWRGLREFVATGDVVASYGQTVRIDAGLRYSSENAPYLASWTIENFPANGSLARVALSRRGETLSYLGAPVIDGLSCAMRLDRWEFGRRQLEQDFVFPSGRGISSAVAPEGDYVAAIADYVQGEERCYMLYIWRAEGAELIHAAPFESPMTDPATISFDSRGEHLIVSSPTKQMAWRRDGDLEWKPQGAFGTDAEFAFSATARIEPRMVLRYVYEGIGTRTEILRWVDARSPNAP